MSAPVLFFGQKGGGAIYKFDTGHSDAETAYPVLVKPRPISPAGAGGDCKFRRLYLVLKHSMACTLRMTPILDGVELTDEAVDFALDAEAEPVTTPFEFGLSLPVLDSALRERFRRALRGTWFTFKVELVGALGEGSLTFESAEVEYKVIRESKEPA